MVVRSLALTVPLRVAPVTLTLVAALVVADGMPRPRQIPTSINGAETVASVTAKARNGTNRFIALRFLFAERESDQVEDHVDLP